jgi:hypothetical protein
LERYLIQRLCQVANAGTEAAMSKHRSAKKNQFRETYLKTFTEQSSLKLGFHRL